MSLKERLYEDMKVAMKAGERLRLDTIRMTLSAVKKLIIDGGRELEEAEESAILRTALKQRREAAEAFEKGGRQELADKERAEAVIIEAYLPAQLDDATLEASVREAIASTGATSAKDLGKVIKEILSRHGDSVDGRRVKDAALKLLGG